MQVLPAIDLLEGRAVRLWRGQYDRATVYGDDPVEVARRWVAEGATRLHVVDLDGARAGCPKHLEVVARMRAAVDVPIQVGGGVRTQDDVAAWRSAGADWVILGTVAALHPEFVGEAVALQGAAVLASLDIAHGQARVAGWEQTAGLSARAILAAWRQAGLRECIVTDVTRDGTLSGVGEEAAALAASSGLRFWVAGGVATAADLVDLRPWSERGCLGAIVGRALYEGTLTLKEVLA